MPKFSFTAFTSTGKHSGDITATTPEDAVLHLDADLPRSGRGDCKRVVIDDTAYHPDHIRTRTQHSN